MSLQPDGQIVVGFMQTVLTGIDEPANVMERVDITGYRVEIEKGKQLIIQKGTVCVCRFIQTV